MRSVALLMETPSTQHDKTVNRIAFAILAATFAWCLIPLTPNSADEDFWGHVQYGRDLLRDGLPATGTYNFTAVGYRWINHENLSEVAFALLVDNFGPTSVLVMKCLLGLLVLGLIAWRSRIRNVGVPFIAIVCVVISINLSFYWNCRPQLFSFALFAVMIALVDYAFFGNRAIGNESDRTKSEARLRLVPLTLTVPLLWVWSNTHGGFLAGCASCLALTVASTFDRLRRGTITKSLAIAAVCIAGSGCLVTLLNPYGWRLHAWLWESLSVPRPEVPEWHPPEWFAAASVKLWAMISLATLSLVFTRKRRDWGQMLLLCLISWQVTKHQRHIPFLAILIGFWIPVHLQSALQRLVGPQSTPDNERAAMSPQLRKLVIGCTLTVAISFGITVVKRLGQMRVGRAEYPVSAVQFAADQQLSGRMLVTAKWGQYLLSTLGKPDDSKEGGLLVAFDGRFRTCYPQEIVDMHFDFILGMEDPTRRHRSPMSPPPDPSRVLDYGNPDFVLIDRSEKNAVSTMARHNDDWTLLYQDQVAQLWGRSSQVDITGSSNYVEPTERIIGNTEQTGYLSWPAAPNRLATSPKLADSTQGKSKTSFTGN